MRRGCSSTLFVIGGWILSSISVAGLVPADERFSPWGAVALLAAIAAPFLLVGAWISPGKRWAELGLTMMFTAGAVAFITLTMILMTNDEGFQRFMPEPRFTFALSSPALIVAVLAIGAGGYAMWRRGGGSG